MSEEQKRNELTSFKVGDSVRLKTGEGPLMRIISFEIDKDGKTINWDRAICNWTKKNKEYTATYDTKDLMHDGPMFMYTAIDAD